ncbi:hypothetical protein [Nonomuraea roseoviolacea]|uniref:Uncharacterized protein n=1 Tax=Nonomuraea roseoviolacea subsp. carminata TaxID=160689 RepID=A0ABT1K738_9ACTN|nr:hypothetical protein [Nonomuraea roseoviolacea]MCP2349735.1 hypothetical protein [Nonomuraea roseoviolacea subsp. carminata]
MSERHALLMRADLQTISQEMRSVKADHAYRRFLTGFDVFEKAVLYSLP